MKIVYIGHAAFKVTVRVQISASAPRESITVVTDPYLNKVVGLPFSSVEADIVLVSRDDESHNNVASIRGDPFIVREPGEYERGGVGIEGFSVAQGGSRTPRTAYILSAEGMRLVFLGGVAGKELTSEQLDIIGVADICIVPVGGDDVMGPKEAVNVIHQIEPRVVIPMEYKLKGMKKTKAGGIDAFLKEAGGATERAESFSVNAGSLPQDETDIIVLEAKAEKK